MNRYRRCCLIAVLPLALGCAPEVPKLFDPCTAKDCEPIDAEPDTTDYVVALHEDSFASVELDGEGSTGSISGEVVIHAEDPTCLATSATPCTITLKRLRVDIGSMTLPSTLGDFAWEDVSASVEAPLEAVDSGSGYVVPEGTRVQTCGLVEGRRDAGISEVDADETITVDLEGESLGITLTLPLVVSVGRRSCVEWKLQATIVAAGASPWTQVPE